MMGMDEDIYDFVEEDDFIEGSDFDWDYEFDAPQFFDFTCPEILQESQEAGLWFSHAGNYPASPLILKVKWRGNNQGHQNTTSSSSYDNTASDCDNGSQDSPSKGGEGSPETKANSAPRSSKQGSSNLMKPTLSHLAKLNNARDMLLTDHLCGRHQKSLIHMDERGLLNLGNKRQKIEIGYLLKGSLTKQQKAMLQHKNSKKDENTTPPNAIHSKMKLTIPKEPALETLQRAKIRRSRANSDSSERSELETENFKAPSTNRKMLKPPSPTLSVKSKQKRTEIQAFNLKTTARALQRSSSERNRQDSDLSLQSNPAYLKRSNSYTGDALKKEKKEKPPKTKAGAFSNKILPAKKVTGVGVENTKKESAMEPELQEDNRLPQSPPTELFGKLSLKPDSRSDAGTWPKSRVSTQGSKENAPDSFHPDFWRCVGKMNQCGSMEAIPGIAYQPSVNRSLGIR